MTQPIDPETHVYYFFQRHMPQVRMHGGDFEVLGADEQTGQVTVELHGMCNGCGLAPMTADVIQTKMVDEVDWVTAVTVKVDGQRLDPDEVFSQQLTLPSGHDADGEE